MDMNTFQFGFWVPARSDIKQNTVAVIKLKNAGSDVKNKKLFIRGFNTPQYQGCGRRLWTPTNANWATAATTTWAWQPPSTVQSRSASENACAADDQIFFYNLHVMASFAEININAATKLDFEIDIDGVKYITRQQKTFLEVAIAGTTIKSRGVDQISTISQLPFTLDVEKQVFSIDCGVQTGCPYGAEQSVEFEVVNQVPYSISSENGERVIVSVVGGSWTKVVV